VSVFKRTTTVNFAFFEQVVLGCFFTAKLKSFAGCVHKSTLKDKEVQGSTSKYEEVFSRTPKCPAKEKMFRLPLTQSVNFKTTLKRANRLQVEPLKVNKSQNKSIKVKKHQCRNLFFFFV
jgi:hypothetical protein